MPLPRVWLTVERLLIALVPVIAGTLIIGSMSGIPSELAEADAVIFGIAFGAEIGLAVVLAVRYARHPTWAYLRPTRASMAILIVIAWATIEWPIVQEWARFAQWENLYRHDPEIELDQAKRREQVAMYSRLRRAYQDAMLRPWRAVAVDE
jgi:hypothetical protein